MIGIRGGAGFADQLAQASALHDNHLSMDHIDYGKVKNNPGEVLALIKTMKDREAKGNEIDWTRRATLYMPGNVGPDQKNNTTKSAAFRTLMATNLGERIQRKSVVKYYQATHTAWFQKFLVKYNGEKKQGPASLFALQMRAAVQLPQCSCCSAAAAVQLPQCAVQLPQCSCRSAQWAWAVKWQIADNSNCIKQLMSPRAYVANSLCRGVRDRQRPKRRMRYRLWQRPG
jgi:hypothetical protein